MKSSSLLFCFIAATASCALASTRKTDALDGMREVKFDKEYSRHKAQRMGLFQLPADTFSSLQSVIGNATLPGNSNQIARAATKAFLRHIGYIGLSQFILDNTGETPFHDGWIDSVFVRCFKRKVYGKMVWEVDVKSPLVYCKSFLGFTGRSVRLESEAYLKHKVQHHYTGALSCIEQAADLLNGTTYKERIFLHAIFDPVSSELLVYSISNKDATPPPHDYLVVDSIEYQAAKYAFKATEHSHKKGSTARALRRRSYSDARGDLERSGVIVPQEVVRDVCKEITL